MVGLLLALLGFLTTSANLKWLPREREHHPKSNASHVDQIDYFTIRATSPDYGVAKVLGTSFDRSEPLILSNDDFYVENVHCQPLSPALGTRCSQCVDTLGLMGTVLAGKKHNS